MHPMRLVVLVILVARSEAIRAQQAAPERRVMARRVVDHTSDPNELGLAEMNRDAVQTHVVRSVRTSREADLRVIAVT